MLFYFILISTIFVPQVYSRIEATATLCIDGTTQSIGTLSFVQQDAKSPVVITGTLTSLNASTNQGFHVHVNGISETLPNCTAALGHFNPYNTGHGGRVEDMWARHVGDLGNLMTDANGSVTVNISDSIIQFYNTTQYIGNRTIIVHAMPDDLGMGGIAASNITGNAGGRVACGLIKVTLNTDVITTGAPVTSSPSTTTVSTVVTTATTATTTTITTTKPNGTGTIQSPITVIMFLLALSFIFIIQ